MLTALMSFLIPSSTGRVLVLMPIVLALAERLGFDAESNGRAGMAPRDVRWHFVSGVRHSDRQRGLISASPARRKASTTFEFPMSTIWWCTFRSSRW